LSAGKVSARNAVEGGVVLKVKVTSPADAMTAPGLSNKPGTVLTVNEDAVGRPEIDVKSSSYVNDPANVAPSENVPETKYVIDAALAGAAIPRRMHEAVIDRSNRMVWAPLKCCGVDSDE
jgi:hypothetical protein